MNNNYIDSKLTGEIIEIFYKVYNELGYGFLEKVYENAMIIEFQNNGISCEKQKPVKVYYEDKIIGDYIADIIVENRVIIELKAVKTISPIHEVQLVNYLKATGIEVGLILNFGPDPIIKRKVFTKQGNS